MPLTIEEAQLAVITAKEAQRRAERVTVQTMAALLAARLTELAAECEQVEGFKFETYHEFDDQSSYYWRVSADAVYSDARYDERLYDDLYQVSDGLDDGAGGAKVWAELCGVGCELDEYRGRGPSGEVSVEQLRSRP